MVMNTSNRLPEQIENWSRTYVRNLWARRAEVQLLRPLNVVPQHPWITEHTPRADAERLTEQNPGSRIVRGWICLPFQDSQKHGADFFAHSATRFGSGELVSASAFSGVMSHRFIAADLAENDYLTLVATLIETRGRAILRIELPVDVD
jgi:hypothetical protein